MLFLTININVKQRSVIKQCSIYKYTVGKTTYNQDQLDVKLTQICIRENNLLS